MVSKRIVRALTVVAAGAAALITACKSSTGPSDPFAGSWSVSVANLIYNGDTPPDTGTVSPKPFTLSLVKGGAGQPPYLMTWPLLTWNVTTQQSGAVQMPIPASSATSGIVTVSGDTLLLRIPDSAMGSGCEVDLQGEFTGRTAQGIVAVVGGTCGALGGPEAAGGSWTATKQ